MKECNHSALCCVVPDHILEHIATHGDSVQRKIAHNTLITTATLRGIRQALTSQQIHKNPPQIQTGIHRTVYDCRFRQDLPGALRRGEGDPAMEDVAVNESYDGAGATYSFVTEILKRNSIDEHGMKLDSSVHYGRNYDNAFWDGQQMVYGDGDNRIFQRFTKSISVIAHEFGHGITQTTCGLVYFDQSGALNEHFSDVMGSLVDQRVHGQNASSADWLIGAGLLAPGINGQALRSMAHPGTAYNDPLLGQDPQPDHMSKYQQMDEDSGGVHISSGIPNRSFYLAATGMEDSFKAGQIWYKAWSTTMRARDQFQDCANKVSQAAKDMFGNDSKELAAVIAGWQGVGLSPQI